MFLIDKLKFYKKVVQNKGKEGFDMVVIKGEREEEEKKRRTVCLKKPNLIRPLPPRTTHHDTISPSPPNKNRKRPARKEKREVTD